LEEVIYITHFKSFGIDFIPVKSVSLMHVLSEHWHICIEQNWI